MEREDKQVKDCMIKWAKKLKQSWANGRVGLKFTLNYNLKRPFINLQDCWYMTLHKLSKIYKRISSIDWKSNQIE